MTTLVSNIGNLAVAIRDKLNLMNEALRPASITIVVDGGGAVVTNGVKLDVAIPFECTLVGWTILADQIGSVQFDLWKTDFDHAPPTLVDSMVGSQKPVLNNDIKAHSEDLSDWDIALHHGDIIRINVDSSSVVTRLTFTLQVTRA